MCPVGCHPVLLRLPSKLSPNHHFSEKKIVNRHEQTFNNWRPSFQRATLGSPSPKLPGELKGSDYICSRQTGCSLPPCFTSLVPCKAEMSLFSRNLKSQFEPKVAVIPKFLTVTWSDWCQSVSFCGSWHLPLQLVFTSVLASSLSAGALLTGTNIMHDRALVLGGRHFLVPMTWSLTSEVNSYQSVYSWGCTACLEVHFLEPS